MPPPPTSSISPQITTTTPMASTLTRRIPPPCWSNDETLALIECYRDKWYALRRGNLRAAHWEEVADAVAARCKGRFPGKTSVQCRHKMEKLRKRYRNEVQRARLVPGVRVSSSWVHFGAMDAMERGTTVMRSSPSIPLAMPRAGARDEDDDEDEESDGYEESGDHSAGYGVRVSDGSMIGNGVDRVSSWARDLGGWGSRAGISAKGYHHFDEGRSGYGIGGKGKYEYGFDGGDARYTRRVLKSAEEGSRKKRGREEVDHDPVKEMVEVLKRFGEGFMRMEKVKMDLAREIEQMRMEMEMKRTERILEGNQKLVDALVKGFFEERKKAKMTSRPEL
ncbi:hypothetical protein Drorol1_Dr00005076 [Drosera rotundifolia]